MDQIRESPKIPINVVWIDFASCSKYFSSGTTSSISSIKIKMDKLTPADDYSTEIS